MFFYPFNQWRQGLECNLLIFDSKFGDVTGDGVIDSVYLIGEKNFGPESGFIENIRVVIIDGATHRVKTIYFESNAGYNPRLFLGDFTGNKAEEILVSIFSGGSGGMSWYYVYSVLNNKTRMLFDYEEYNNEYKYKVMYKDNYSVGVINQKLLKKYSIDIKYKGEDYLSKIYDEDGKLKEPIEGYVVPLSGLYPIDFSGNGIYELYAMRRVIGLYNADSIGIVQTSLQWNGEEFIPLFENVGIYGEIIK